MNTPQIIAIEIPIGSFNVQIHNGKIRYKNNKKQISLYKWLINKYAKPTDKVKFYFESEVKNG